MLGHGGPAEKVDASIAADYVKKTGKTKRPEIAAWMAAETWFTAQEAKDAGFVDRIAAVDANGGGAQDRALWNLSAYKNAPKLKPAPAAEPQVRPRALERRLAMYEKANRIAA
jgi:ATP-dependent Clp protease protease subunit